jgi:hypothetical protein
MYVSIRTGIKQTVITIGAYPFCQLLRLIIDSLKGWKSSNIWEKRENFKGRMKSHLPFASTARRPNFYRR